jgi:hypothetical protein
LKGSAEFLSQIFGPAAQSTWPLSGFGALCLLLFSVGILALAWHKQPQKRFRAFGFFCVLAGTGLIALAIGWARPGKCYNPWYYELAVLTLCCAYMIGVVYHETSLGRLLQFGLLLSTCTFLNENCRQILTLGRDWGAIYRAFDKDILSGMPMSLLIDRYSGRINAILGSPPEQRETVANDLAILRRAAIGNYKYLRDDIPMVVTSLPVPGIDINEFTRGGDIGYGFRVNPNLRFTLERPRWVHALRVRCEMDYRDKDRSGVTYRVSWRTADHASFTDRGKTAKCSSKQDQPAGHPRCGSMPGLMNSSSTWTITWIDINFLANQLIRISRVLSCSRVLRNETAGLVGTGCHIPSCRI